MYYRATQNKLKNLLEIVSKAGEEYITKEYITRNISLRQGAKG